MLRVASNSEALRIRATVRCGAHCFSVSFETACQIMKRERIYSCTLFQTVKQGVFVAQRCLVRVRSANNSEAFRIRATVRSGAHCFSVSKIPSMESSCIESRKQLDLGEHSTRRAWRGRDVKNARSIGGAGFGTPS